MICSQRNYADTAYCPVKSAENELKNESQSADTLDKKKEKAEEKANP